MTNIKKKGFTIIEVVLVLAIAGLIFLMVFIALPALQRTQRDTQRRQDFSRLSAALVQYQTNNSTKADNLPSVNSNSLCAPGEVVTLSNAPYSTTTNVACQFIKNYLNEANATDNMFLDPDGEPYALLITPNFASNAANVRSTTVSNTSGGASYSETLTIANITGGRRATIDATSNYKAHIIFVLPGAKCDGETAVTSQRRHYAIMYRMEGAGTFCLDNQ